MITTIDDTCLKMKSFKIPFEINGWPRFIFGTILGHETLVAEHKLQFKTSKV